MAIANIQNINIGLPNESVGSDSLYTAFNKVNNNFATLFSCASPYTTFVGANGVSACANSTTNIVTITNTGVSSLTAGAGIVLSGSNGNVTISSTGGGNGNGGGTVTSVGIIPVSTNRLTVTNSPIVSSGNISIDLAQSGVTAASYTNPSLTIDTFGRVTSAANGSVVSNVGLTPGSGISITNNTVGSNYQFTVINTGVTSLSAGTGIQLSGGNGAVTVTATVGSVGNIAVINLDGNVSNVLSGTGTWIAASSGSSTGNITFTGATISTNLANTAINILANGTGAINIVSYDGGYTQLENDSANGVAQIWVEDGNARIYTDNGGEWVFGNTGATYVSTLTLPDYGIVTSTPNTYPTMVAWGSYSHDGPTLDWTNTDDLSTLYDNTVLRNATFIGENGLYIGINENNVGGGNFRGHWTFDNVGNLTTPGSIYLSPPYFEGPTSSIVDTKSLGIQLVSDYYSQLNYANTSYIVVNTDGVSIVANGTGSGSIWQFDNTGDLTLPSGNISTANVITANYFVGNGSNLSNIQGSNVSGAVSFATTANAVAGANVSGTVANATYATTAGTAYSVSAANITGTVNLANYATTANAVALANVSGAGNIASINLSGNSSQVLYGNGAFAAAPSGGLTTFTRSSTWQSSSGAVTVPAVDVPIYVRSACTLIEATILTQGGTGSCVVDIWKTPIGTYPPTSANSICGGNYPSITSGTTLVKTSLTGWTTAVSAGDTIMFHLTSSSTFTYITIQLTFST